MSKYDNWKSTEPRESNRDASVIDEDDVRYFEHMQPVEVISNGARGEIIGCRRKPDGSRLWDVRFVYDPNGDDDETDLFAEYELRAV